MLTGWLNRSLKLEPNRNLEIKTKLWQNLNLSRRVNPNLNRQPNLGQNRQPNLNRFPNQNWRNRCILDVQRCWLHPSKLSYQTQTLSKRVFHSRLAKSKVSVQSVRREFILVVGIITGRNRREISGKYGLFFKWRTCRNVLTLDQGDGRSFISL